MLLNFKRTLVLAPHTDDGELGAGGLISRLIAQGSSVYYIAFSTADQSLPKELPPDSLKREVRAATRVIGIPEDNLIIYNYEVRRLNYHRQEILEQLIKLRAELKPDLVLVPSYNDIHQDHSTIAHEGVRAFKNINILGYELIWNNLRFETALFVKLDHENVELKCKALQQYVSQQGKDYMSAEFIEALARTRGVQIGCKYAEAFDAIRLVI